MLRPVSLGDLLTESNDLPTLEANVTKILEAIDRSPVRDVQAVFDFCEKLICHEDVSFVDIGYVIITKLARQIECTPMHRNAFYQKIVREDRPQLYREHYRTYLFTDLTRGGRDLEGFADILPQIIQSLYDEFVAFEDVTIPTRIKGRAFGLVVPDSLEVLINVVKFNAKFIFDAEITRLIERMFVCRESITPADYVKVIDIIDTLIAYIYIPRRSVLTLTKLLSFWIGSEYLSTRTVKDKPEGGVREDKLEVYWQPFVWLLSTHLKDLAIDALLQCLEDDSPSFQQVRGAAMLIYRSHTDAQTNRTISLDLPRLLEALARPAVGNLLEMACIRLQLLYDLLGDDKIKEVFTAELDWSLLQQVIIFNATTSIDYCSKNDHESEHKEANRTDINGLKERHALVSAIIAQLEVLPGVRLTQERALRKVALSCATSLNSRQRERLIKAYNPSAFRISVGNWLPEIQELAHIFIQNHDAALVDRQRALNVVNRALRRAQELGEEDAGEVCGKIILDSLTVEKCRIFRGNLVHCVISFMSEHLVTSEDGFQKVLAALAKSARIECRLDSADTSAQQQNVQSEKEELLSIDERRPIDRASFPSILPVAGLDVLLMRSIMTHPHRAIMVFNEIISLVSYLQTHKDPEATVMLLRGLFRIRSDIEHHIFFVASPEGESLATALDRNFNEPRHSLRRKSNPWDQEESPPSWRYGDIQGLPEDPPTTISPILRSDSKDPDRALDMELWLTTVIALIKAEDDWETYSYIIVHLGAQLSNQSLFTETIPRINELAAFICRKVQSQTVTKPPEASNLRQGDVALCLINILTTIIGYHWHFPRTDTENMVSTLLTGLTAWDITTVPCVHGLTLCCYELPISLSRDLVRIVEKMSTIVTKSDAAIHILEFLAGLSRLELTSRFHGDEIKTVFGVCFSYIEYVRGKRYDESQQRASGRSANPTRQGSVASGQRPSTEDIPQYVFAISYHVITFWYITLRAEDQKKYLPWMEQRLLSRDQAGNIEDDALVTLDHLWRVAEGRGRDQPALTPTLDGPSSSDEPASQTWISGYCMLTISSHQDDSSKDITVEIIERRASGTDFRVLRRPSTAAATPEEVFAQLNLSATMDGPFHSILPPLILPMTDATKRALGIFDRTSPVDFFKCGVIYVGEAQTQEAEILCNISGSPDYNRLIAGLGTRITLPSHRGNVAGLDTSEGAFDGRYTYQHTDGGVTTLNYHITTLMPTNRDVDPLCTRKKSHIGNDYVNIVFNNSGLVSGFNFHTFPSAFNYVYIVVTPEARQTFLQTRQRSTKKERWFEDSWFKVQVMTREDFPDISSAAESKVVSGEALAAYVRNLALNAEVFCRVWTNRGSMDYPSSWRSRLGQIRQLRERVEKMERERIEKGE